MFWFEAGSFAPVLAFHGLVRQFMLVQTETGFSHFVFRVGHLYACSRLSRGSCIFCGGLEDGFCIFLGVLDLACFDLTVFPNRIHGDLGLFELKNYGGHFQQEGGEKVHPV